MPPCTHCPSGAANTKSKPAVFLSRRDGSPGAVPFSCSEGAPPVAGGRWQVAGPRGSVLPSQLLNLQNSLNSSPFPAGLSPSFLRCLVYIRYSLSVSSALFYVSGVPFQGPS